MANIPNFYMTNRPRRSLSADFGDRTRLLAIVGFLIAAICLLPSGCSVQEHKNGDAENVRLHTPIGGMDVRTDSAAAIDTGLPVYPGSKESGKNGSDSGSADIHMSFGKWQLHVKAVEYRSPDPEDKLVAFYKNAMSSYGDVLTCKGKSAIGSPTATRQGLTCANGHDYHVSMDAHSTGKHVDLSTPRISGDIELLAGSPENQHIVEFTPISGGTRFSVVMVQLPHKNRTD